MPLMIYDHMLLFVQNNLIFCGGHNRKAADVVELSSLELKIILTRVGTKVFTFIFCQIFYEIQFLFAKNL
jgi:hypothetical protein